MRLLEDSHEKEIARILGRPLGDDEKRYVERLSLLPDAALQVARKLSADSRILAVKYLQELAAGTRLSDATSFLEEVVLGTRSVAEWDRVQHGSSTSLIRVGFFRELRHGQPAGPSLKEAIRPQSQPEEAKIVSYLKGGHVLSASPGLVRDAIDPAAPIIGSLQILTDGTYAWPSDLAHYVEKRHAQLPPDVVAHMTKNDWRVPAKVDLASLVLS